MDELVLENDPSLERGDVGRLSKMFPCFTIRVLHDLATETVMQVGQLHESHEDALVVPKNGYVPDAISPYQKDYDEQSIIIENIPLLKFLLCEFLRTRNLEAIKL